MCAIPTVISMVKTRFQSSLPPEAAQRPSLSPPVSQPSQGDIDLDDVIAASPVPPHPPPSFNLYDLGPGGCPRNLTGSSFSFSRLRTGTPSSEERFTVFRQYIQFRMLQNARPQVKRETCKPVFHPKSQYLDLYRILGVRANCTNESLRKAFKRQVRKTHPDKGGNSRRFDQVHAAYGVLSKPELRSIYDEEGFSGLQLADPVFDISKFLRRRLQS